jgi:hypothetical protein
MFALGSVHPAVDNHGPPWRNYNSAVDPMGSNDHGAARANAACAINAVSTDDRACFHRAQGDEDACQQ